MPYIDNAYMEMINATARNSCAHIVLLAVYFRSVFITLFIIGNPR